MKNQGQLRLQREAKMAKKDIEAQIKKGGLKENFVCLPDPSDPYTWYYVVYGMEEPAEYTGGYYLGVISCPDVYPAKAPRIDILTENGRFRVKERSEGICLSISHHHPESWNPAWKVNNIVIGLISFWITGEDTYGAFYDHEFKNQKDFTPKENR
jgi:ubiquitin-protein ligase